VTNMRQMFHFALVFNQSLDTWGLNVVNDLLFMLTNCGMDCTNYSTTLIGWNNNPATPNGRSLGANGRTYETNAEAARTNLIDVKGWTITGDALAPVTTAEAGPNEAICSLTTTLAGNTPDIGTGTWTQVSGPGTANFADVNAPNTGVNASVPGTYRLRWTINAPCAASSDDVAITFAANPTANAGDNQTSNATCGLTQVTLAANTPSVGTGEWSIQSGTGGSFGDASSPTSTFSGNAGATYTLRWTVTNAPCAASTDEMAVTFNQSPSFATCPPGVTVSVTSCCSATATYAAAAAATTPASTVTYLLGGATTGSGSGTGSGQTFNLGTTTVNLTATNSCGNSNCSFNVVVQAAEINVQGNGMSIVDGDVTPSTSDHTDFGQTTGPNIVRTFTVQNTGAVALSVSGITLGGVNPGQFSVSALTPLSPVAPNGSATFTVTYAPNAVAVHNATVNIASGDCDEANYDFAIRGELTCTDPMFTACPSNQPTVNASDNTCSVAVSYTVSTTGLPMPALTYVFSGATTGSGSGTGSGSNFNVGTTTVTVTATNPCGAPTCSFKVTVQDIQNPTITCPGNISKTTDANQCSAVTAYANPTFSDNCSGAYLTLTSAANTASNSAFPKGSTNVAWKATDAAGNSAVCNFTVTVTDGQPPSIVCPANIIRPTDADQCGAIVAYANPTYSDNCPLDGLAGLDHLMGGLSNSSFPKGITVVIWQATDGAGLTKTCSFTITVNDTQKPNITCPANQTRSTDLGLCSAVVTYPTPKGADNCGLTTGQPMWISGGTMPVASGANSIATFQKGINTVTWRATDGAGLTNTCTFRVTVNDTEAPALTCPAPMNLFTATNTCSAVANYTNPVFTDNCAPTTGTAVRISGLVSGSAFSLGNSNVVFQATDAAGNTRRCTMVVTVTDNQLPVITCPAPVVVNGTGSPCAATVFYGSTTASDNCAGTLTPFLVTGLSSGSQFPAGVTTNTFRAVAPNGQSSECTFSVTVNCGSGMGNTGLEDRKQDLDAQITTTQKTNLGLTLAPNPAAYAVTVSIEGLGANGGTLLVFDQIGRLVQQQVVAGDQRTSTLQVAEFAPGLYRVMLRTDAGMVTKTLVVVKE
jgi:hypothetical protein